MSRSQFDELRTCPACGNENIEGIGLRNYSKLTSKLPGKVGFMDYDAVLHQAKTGRKLVLEFKKPGQYLGQGQRITLRDEVRNGADVWVIWELGNGKVDAAAMNKVGQLPFIQRGMNEEKLTDLVADWWAKGWNEQAA